MDLLILYRKMDPSHLSTDEVEYELLIRDILYDPNEHESIKRRRLRECLKQERLENTSIDSYSRSWQTTREETELIFKKIITINSLFESPKLDARNREKAKTRLIHYKFRIARLRSAVDAENYMEGIIRLEKEIDRMCTIYYPVVANIPEVQNVEEELTDVLQNVRSEINDLNQMVGNVEQNAEESKEKTKRNTLIEKTKELESSRKKTEEILEKIAEYENGTADNFPGLIQSFKEFVIQTSEQDKVNRLKEIERQEQRIMEVEKHIWNKRKLEKLLANLNSNLKTEKVNHSPSVNDPARSINPTAPTHSVQSKADESDSSRSVPSLYDNRRRKSNEKKHQSSYKNARERSRKTQKKGSKIEISDSESQSVTTSVATTSMSSSTESMDSFHRTKHTKHRKSKMTSIKRIPVVDWKLTYDGKDGGRRISEFLKEVKIRAFAENVSEKELYRSAIHLFTGRAKDWFLDCYENREFRNWAELKRELKREFLPPDLDYQLEIQVTNRLQGRGEKFTDYYHEIQKIFHAMTKPMSERRKFKIIWRNMRHDYKNAMIGTKIQDLSKLRRIGRKVDENNWYLFRRQAENNPRLRNQQISEMETKPNNDKKEQSPKGTKIFPNSTRGNSTKNDSGIGKGQFKQISDNYKNKPEKSQLEPMEGSSTGTLKVLVDKYQRPPIGVCYNCRQSGHHYVECPQQRKKFCRLCGFSEVFTSTCPFCQKNGMNST